MTHSPSSSESRISILSLASKRYIKSASTCLTRKVGQCAIKISIHLHFQFVSLRTKKNLRKPASSVFLPRKRRGSVFHSNLSICGKKNPRQSALKFLAREIIKSVLIRLIRVPATQKAWIRVLLT